MNPWFAKAVVLIATIVMMLIRSPHGRRSRTVTVAKSRKGLLEVVLLGIAWIGFFVPILWIATPWLGFADSPLYPLPLVIGSVVLALSLWLFHRSHADLGANWSITLEIRKSHRLVTEGGYRRVRHPMYVALLLYGLGQAAASQAGGGIDERALQGRVRRVCEPDKEARSGCVVMLANIRLQPAAAASGPEPLRLKRHVMPLEPGRT